MLAQNWRCQITRAAGFETESRKRVLGNGSLCCEILERPRVTDLVRAWFPHGSPPDQVIGALYIHEFYRRDRRDLAAHLRAAALISFDESTESFLEPPSSEARSKPLSPHRAHLLACQRIDPNSLDRRRNRAWIVGGHEVSGDAVLNDLARSATRADAGLSRAHRLEEDEPESFVAARHDEEGAPAVETIEFFGRHFSQKTNGPAEPQQLRLLFQSGPVVAPSRDEELRPRVPDPHFPPDVEEKIMSFVALFTRHPSHDERVISSRALVLVLDFGKSRIADRDLGALEPRIRPSKLRRRMSRDGQDSRRPSKRRCLEPRKRLPGIDPHHQVDEVRPSVHKGERDRKQMRVQSDDGPPPLREEAFFESPGSVAQSASSRGPHGGTFDRSIRQGPDLDLRFCFLWRKRGYDFSGKKGDSVVTDDAGSQDKGGSMIHSVFSRSSTVRLSTSSTMRKRGSCRITVAV